MKKKFLRTLLCFVCAFCCTVGFTACGDNDDDATKKYHTAQQWSAAFSDSSTTDCYSLQEIMGADGVWSQQIRGLNYDKNSEYYYYSYNYKIVSGDEVTIGYSDETAYKAGGHYYTQRNGSADNIDSNMYEITSAQFAAKTHNSYMDIAEKLLDGCKNHYDDFEAHGSTSFGNGISGRYYKAKNVRLEIDQSLSIVFEEVTVGITDAGALCDIEATFDGEDITTKDDAVVKHKYIYCTENSDYYVNYMPRSAPTRLEGNTFRLVRIDDVNAEGAPSVYDEWMQSVVTANSNKTITAKADGTLEGDIEIDMGGGETLALNTMKYTENFFEFGEGEYGEVTVSNAHIAGLTEAQKVTLTGNIAKDGGYSGAGYNNAFRLLLDRNGQVFAFFFAPVAN